MSAETRHNAAVTRLNALQRWEDLLRLSTMILVVVVIAGLILLGFRLNAITNSRDAAFARQDCIAHVNAAFFGHLAEALAEEPSSFSRQQFLDKMTADAKVLARIDDECPR